jgi:hypothetical protein
MGSETDERILNITNPVGAARCRPQKSLQQQKVKKRSTKR